MVRYFVLVFILLNHILPLSLIGQQAIQWIDPLAQENILHSQAFSGIGYTRLPDEAKETVREAVWNLSRHAAGLEIRFHSDAPSIQVRFIPTGPIQMPHMPATGVSGLDLYTLDEKGNWLWVKGDYSFGDTVKYNFKLKSTESHSRECKLYLPLYNGVKNLELGVEEGYKLTFIPRGDEKPIMVYGTSIAQGACASRPGMAWPAIVGRQLHTPVINLGFSGNGRLEPEVLEFIASVPSSVYVLDCLPNLVPSANWSEEEIKKRIRHAVTFLKERHPDIPILLVEHAGYSDAFTNLERDDAVSLVNQWVQEVYVELLTQGTEEIYLLTKEDIGLSMDATVDGTHPTDWGMQQYADAYTIMLQEILE